jgi:hypothetical protein
MLQGGESKSFVSCHGWGEVLSTPEIHSDIITKDILFETPSLYLHADKHGKSLGLETFNEYRDLALEILTDQKSDVLIAKALQSHKMNIANRRIEKITLYAFDLSNGIRIFCSLGGKNIFFKSMHLCPVIKKYSKEEMIRLGAATALENTKSFL